MVPLQRGHQDYLLANYDLPSKIRDSAYSTMYRIPNDGDKRSGI